MKSWRILVCTCGVFLALAAPALGQNPLEPPRRPSGPYEIRGIVVDAKTEQPLAEVELSILESAQPAGQAFEVIQSDANGSFRFANLAEGKYTVQASRQGYTEQAFLQHENFWTGIAVGLGKDSTHVRFPLSPSATITGQVTDENAEPVRGAMVTLWTEQIGNGNRTVEGAQKTQTDDEGRYRFGHLLAGKYSVSVQATPWYSRYWLTQRASRMSDAMSSEQNGRGEVTTGIPVISDSMAGNSETLTSLPDLVYTALYYPNTRDWHEMEWMNLRAQQLEHADFHLVPEPSVHLQIHTGIGEDGQTKGERLLEVLPGGAEIDARSNTTFLEPGTIEIAGIAAGRYRVRPYEEMSRISGEGQTLDLSGSLDLQLNEVPMTGRTIRGILRTEEGELNAARGIVQLKDAKGRTYESLYFGDPRFSPGSKRGFEFQDTSSGPQTLEFSVVQPADLVVEKIEAKGAKVAGRTIETDGTQEVSVVVTVAEGSSSIEGTVLKNGKPFAGAMVLLMPENHKDWERLVRRDQSDSDGTFRLAAILPGRYALMALENGWGVEWSKPEVLQPFLAKAQKLEIGAAQGPRVVLEVQ